MADQQPPAGPSDFTTLTDLTEAYRGAGYVSDLHPEEETVRCESCGASSPADQVEVHSLRRLEGASDPDDMVAVLAVVCPACGTLGVAVAKFGPDASEAEANLLLRSQDVRFTAGDVPPAAAPGEGD